MKSYLAYQIMGPAFNCGVFFSEVSKITQDQKYMQMAVNLALLGKYDTWTNPLVGAVIVKNNQVIATGYHHKFGKEHAEINALSHLDQLSQAKGATIYVSLEPCSHYGKTPPCARKLVEVGIKRVVVGQLDPNPLVAGKGIQILKQAGIEITNLNCTQYINQTYNFFYTNQRPFITLKYAMSLDGKLNFQHGQRSILTGETVHDDSQRLRMDNQAILIGEHTLDVDDPLLTVRLKIMEFPPIKILLVNDVNQINMGLRIFSTAGSIWILSKTISKKKMPKNVRVFADDSWHVEQIIELMHDEGIQSLLVEGGSDVQARFMCSGIVDQIVSYVSGRVFGGTALPVAKGAGMNKPLKMNIQQVAQLGPDVKITARRN